MKIHLPLASFHRTSNCEMVYWTRSKYVWAGLKYFWTWYVVLCFA